MQDKKINVLHVIWSLHFGGIREMVLNLCREQLKNEALKVSILSGKMPGNENEIFNIDGLEFFFSDLKSGYDLSNSKYRKTKQLMSGFDIIHIHSYNPLLAKAAVKSRKKIIYSEHGNFGFYRKKRAAEIISFLMQKHFLNRKVDFITFNSNFTNAVANQRFGLKHVNKKTIYNGVVVHKFDEKMQESRIKCNLPVDSFIIGMTCRFVEFKRLDRLITCFAQFCNNKNALLVLVGDGPLKPRLEQQCLNLKISEKVFFTGYKKKVTPYQNAFNLCVMPSAKEPFGLVAVELLSLGKPVIVYEDSGGLAEIISGISKEDIVSNNDELISRLEYYYQNKNTTEQHSEARKNHAQQFDIRFTEDQFFEICKKILGK